MDAPRSAPQLSLQPFDPEVFRRVWQRVMPDQSLSPVSPGPAPLPAVPALSPAPGGTEALPACLGEGSRPHAQVLREVMDQTRGLSLTLRRLARRSPGRAARVLLALSARLDREARRLSAAYFLITGERYAPGQAPLPLSGPLEQGLRALFRQFLLRASRLQGSALEVGDPCLKELLQELEDQAEHSANRLRALLEELT